MIYGNPVKIFCNPVYIIYIKRSESQQKDPSPKYLDENGGKIFILGVV